MPNGAYLGSRAGGFFPVDLLRASLGLVFRLPAFFFCCDLPLSDFFSWLITPDVSAPELIEEELLDKAAVSGSRNKARHASMNRAAIRQRRRRAIPINWKPVLSREEECFIGGAHHSMQELIFQLYTADFSFVFGEPAFGHSVITFRERMRLQM